MIEEIGSTDAEGVSKLKQLGVGYPANLSFEFGQCAAGNVPTEEVELGGEVGLREAFLLADLPHDWTNNVAGAHYVPDSELDNARSGSILSSEFGTLRYVYSSSWPG